MHARGRRRAKARAVSRNAQKNDATTSARPVSSARSRRKVITSVLQFAALLLFCHVVLRFGFLSNHLSNWFPPASLSSSRNQQRVERSRQRQELRRQRKNAKRDNLKASPSVQKEQEQPHQKQQQHEKLMNPHDSHPPNAIPLFSKSPTSLAFLPETAIQRRHECISAIRQRHDELLGPYLRPLAREQEHHLQGTSVAASAPPQPNVLLVDPAYHKNVGDHMITLGEIAFLKRLGYNFSSSLPQEAQTKTSVPVYRECNYFQGGPFLQPCSELLNEKQQKQEHGDDSSVALWHGGGNWGDLWPKVQTLRASSLKPLFAAHYNPIISMPQSLYFHEQMFQKDNSNIMRQAVKEQGSDILNSTSEQHERQLILTWREQKSHDEAVQLYPFATHLVVPDIAFQLGPYEPIITIDDDESEMTQNQRRPQLDILLLLRDDHESIYLEQRNRQAIRQMLSSITTGRDVRSGNRLLFAIVDWPDRLDRFDSPNGKKDIFFTNTSIQLLSMGRVLVCDRLHAAILAYLMGIPFVFVDQSTGKIHRTLKTAFASVGGNGTINDAACLDGKAAMWAQADNLTHALEKAIFFLESDNHKEASHKDALS